jgi:hypothetical protein
MLQISPWETKPHNLVAFMNTINVDAGWGTEPIEMGLWHANKEHGREPITQVILIYHLSPNSYGEAHVKRNTFGHKYLKRTRFAQVTYYEKE